MHASRTPAQRQFNALAYARTFGGGVNLFRGTREACVDYVLANPVVDGRSTHVRVLGK